MICGLATPGGRPTSHTALGLRAASSEGGEGARQRCGPWPAALALPGLSPRSPVTQQLAQGGCAGWCLDTGESGSTRAQGNHTLSHLAAGPVLQPPGRHLKEPGRGGPGPRSARE